MSRWWKSFRGKGPGRRPELGRLRITDDEDVDAVYEIADARYNVYRDEDRHWITLRVSAPVKIEPRRNEDNPEPFLELNLPFSEDPAGRLRPSEVLAVSSYDEELYNLTDLYHWSHLPFDGEVRILSCEEGHLRALLTGEAAGDPVNLSADFRFDPTLRRSFS